MVLDFIVCEVYRSCPLYSLFLLINQSQMVNSSSSETDCKNKWKNKKRMLVYNRFCCFSYVAVFRSPGGIISKTGPDPQLCYSLHKFVKSDPLIYRLLYQMALQWKNVAAIFYFSISEGLGFHCSILSNWKRFSQWYRGLHHSLGGSLFDPPTLLNSWELLWWFPESSVELWSVVVGSVSWVVSVETWYDIPNFCPWVSPGQNPCRQTRNL